MWGKFLGLTGFYNVTEGGVLIQQKGLGFSFQRTANLLSNEIREK